MKQWFFKCLIIICIAAQLTCYAGNYSTEVLEPYTHDNNFSWIAGKLVYIGVEGETWGILYDQEDNKKFLLLQGDRIYTPPENIKEGDMVVIQGKIMHLEMSSFMNGDYYNVKKIEPLNAHNQKAKQLLEQERRRKGGAISQ